MSLTSLGKYTPAKVGDRTLMDALTPFVEKLNESGDAAAALRDGVEGASKTKNMEASLGRAVYVAGGPNDWSEVPDPGAHGLACLFLGMLDGLNN
jgi:dihydroxyacetone kinase